MTNTHRTHARVLGALALLIAAVSVVANEPNYVKTTTYYPNNLNVISISYADGLGRGIQSQTYKASSPAGIIISATAYDDAGRPVKSLVPYYRALASGAVPAYVDADFTAITTEADTWLRSTAKRDPAGRPYSESVYSDDPLSRVTKQGAPGLPYSLDGHPARVWYFSRNNADFIDIDPASTTILAALDAGTANGTQNDPHFFLTVTRDPNGGYSQELKDAFGRTVKTWSHTGTKAIIAQYVYDIQGNLLEEIPPADDATSARVASTTYRYNTLGQLVGKTTPETGSRNLYIYDDAGRLVFTQVQEDYLNDNGSLGDSCIVYYYDVFGRSTYTCSRMPNFAAISQTPNNPPVADQTKVRIRNFYDTIDGVQDATGVPATILNNLHNLTGRLVAAISYDQSADKSALHRVVDLLSYNDDGQVEAKYKIVPTKGVQKFSYTYDFQGRITAETYEEDITKPATWARKIRIKQYEYDEMARLKCVWDGAIGSGKKLVRYSYDGTGTMTDKSFYPSSTAPADYAGKIGRVEYQYNVRGWVEKINGVRGTLTPGSPLFTQDLSYLNQYNGNIATSAITYANFTGAQYPAGFTTGTGIYSYTYDKTNRLTSVDLTGGSQLDEAFAYHADGRIKSKSRGTTTPSTLDEYIYSYAYGYGSGISNQLEKITTHPTKSGNANYVYDARGNQIVDRSKNMVTEYDWLNMPVSFKFYQTLPATVDGQPLSRFNVKKLDPNSQVSEVRMMYDAGGNRVLKTELSKRSIPAPGS